MIPIGILTPGTVAFPGGFNEWERGSTIEDIARIAQAADRLGYHHLTCAEHVMVPVEVAPVRGATYWDPLVTLSFLAARTERINLATFVVVLGYHHPLALAKRYGTLDLVSGGRLVLGVGVGTLHEEFELLGAPYEDRGARADEAIAALRAIYGRRTPEHSGRFYEIADVVVEPFAPRTDLPIWVGGRTRRSLRRALELGDAWAPSGLSDEEIASALSFASGTEAWDRREEPLDVVIQPPGLLDPIGDAAGTLAAFERSIGAGATILHARFAHDSVESCIEQLEAAMDLATEVGPP